LIKEIFEVAARVKRRSTVNVGLKLMEEAGELAKEINILDGYINKPEGVDGVLGEAIDLIITAGDVIWNTYGKSISEETIMAKLAEKLKKWEDINSKLPEHVTFN